MSSRVAAWLKKPDTAWDATRTTLAETTLYLVQRTGPLVFSVRDERASTFKVVLGNPHECSCKDDMSSDQGLCIHQMFCLLKVLRVAESHPLSYQYGMTDSEADMILSGQCGGEGIRSKNRNVENLSAVARAKRLEKQKGKKGASAGLDEAAEASANGWVERQVLGDGDDETCPICQDSMDKDQALTWCRKGCGNNIHAKCMQTFAQYKITNRQGVCCPLCREEWQIELLKDDVRGKAALKGTCAPIYCTSCTHSVRSGSFYRCLECSQQRALDALKGNSISSALGMGRMPTPVAIPTSNTSSTSTAAIGEIGTLAGSNPPTAAGARAQKHMTPSHALASRRSVDFCESCFSSSRVGREHLTHHFVCSEANGQLASNATASGDVDDAWQVAANPLHVIRPNAHAPHAVDGVVTPAGLSVASDPSSEIDSDNDRLLNAALSELERREITMDDYELLLELDRTPNASVSVQLCKALPKYIPTWEAVALAGDTIPPPVLSRIPHNGNTVAITASHSEGETAPQCWCGGDPILLQQISQSTLRQLPCGHVTHDWCLSTAMDRVKDVEGTGYSRFRCQHAGCNQVVFRNLSRRRKKTILAGAGKDKDKEKAKEDGADDHSGLRMGGLEGVGMGLMASGQGLSAAPSVLSINNDDAPAGISLDAPGSFMSISSSASMPMPAAAIGIGSTELRNSSLQPRPSSLLPSAYGGGSSIPSQRPGYVPPILTSPGASEGIALPAGMVLEHAGFGLAGMRVAIGGRANNNHGNGNGNGNGNGSTSRLLEPLPLPCGGEGGAGLPQPAGRTMAPIGTMVKIERDRGRGRAPGKLLMGHSLARSNSTLAAGDSAAAAASAQGGDRLDSSGALTLRGNGAPPLSAGLGRTISLPLSRGSAGEALTSTATEIDSGAVMIEAPPHLTRAMSPMTASMVQEAELAGAGRHEHVGSRQRAREFNTSSPAPVPAPELGVSNSSRGATPIRSRGGTVVERKEEGEQQQRHAKKERKGRVTGSNALSQGLIASSASAPPLAGGSSSQLGRPPLPQSRGSKGTLASIAAKRKKDQLRSEAARSLQADGRGLRGTISSLPSEHLQPGVGVNRSLLADSWAAANLRY